MSDRDDFHERLERINRQQLALNGAAPGMWQDMAPVLDRLAEIFDPAKSAQAAAKYAANRLCPHGDWTRTGPNSRCADCGVLWRDLSDEQRESINAREDDDQ